MWAIQARADKKFANQCCRNLHNEMNEMKSSSLGELNLERKNELKHSFNLFLHCFGLILFLSKTKEKEKKF